MQVLVIFGQTATATEPSEGALHDPALGQNDKSLDVAALDDFERQVRGTADSLGGRLSLVSTIGKHIRQIGVTPLCDAHHGRNHIAVLDVGGRDRKIDDEPLRVDGDVTLLAFDFLSCIEP